MYTPLTYFILMSNLVIVSAENGKNICGFAMQGLFTPNAINISETSRCDNLRRVKSLLTVFETSVIFQADNDITDCTSPIILRNSVREQTSNLSSSNATDVVVECMVPSSIECNRLFFHMREAEVDFPGITKLLDIISPDFLNVSTAHLARCNANITELLTNSSEMDLVRDNYNTGVRHIEKYLSSGRSIISLKIHQNRIYTHSFNTSLNSLVRKLIILNRNYSSLLPYNLLINLTELESFDISYNGLYSLPENLFQFNNQLHTCDLSHNMLQAIPANLFKHNIKLGALKLDHNYLETLPPELFLNNREISRIILAHNRLNSLPSTLLMNNFKISNLILNNNRLAELPRNLFPRNSSLLELNLCHNQLKSINLTLLDDPTEKTIAELSKSEYARELVFLRPENRTRQLDGNTLVKSNRLIALNVSHNLLTNFPRDIFRRSQLLRFLDVSHNPGIRRFTNSHFLYSLESLTITDCSIEYVEGILSNYVSFQMLLINTVEFSRNKIKGLDGTVFRKCRLLKVIILKDNLLEHLDPGLFKDLESLYYLNLSGNMLSALPFELLSLQTLFYLNVSRNHIITFGNTPLIPLLQNVGSNLQELDLSRNCLTSSKISSPQVNTSKPLSLAYANFEFNAIRNVPIIPTGHKTFHLQFGNNAIRTVEMENLIIRPRKGIKFQPYVLLKGRPENAQISLCPNPVKKICEISNQSCRDATQENLRLLSNSFRYVDVKRCQDSSELYNNDNISSHLEKIKFQCPFTPTCSKDYYQSILCGDNAACDLQSILVCPITELCPSPCECRKMGFEQRSTVNCSRRGLTDLPSFVPPNAEILHFEHNKLNNLSQFRDPIWKGLTEIYLDYNKITHVDLSYLPPEISKISLRHNALRALAINSTGNSKVEQVWLGGNPWRCDCDALDFKTLLNTSRIIADGNDILCANSNRSIIDTAEEEICPKKLKKVITITLALAIGILMPIFVGIVFVAYYRNKGVIVAYLFSHHPRLFACFCNWDELEEEKLFDAFISYGGGDSHVVQQFVHQLEEKEPHLKLIFHERDWMPGQDIITNIENSVRLSRKTVLILSKEFLQSMWFLLELRTAYYQSVEDKLDRLIVVLKGEIPSLETLDEDLQVLLKTKTYLVWGEKWFWEKLRYALSRRKIK